MEVLLRMIAFLLKYIGYLIMPLQCLFNSNKRVKVPPIKNDLLKLAVVDLAEKIRQKQVYMHFYNHSTFISIAVLLAFFQHVIFTNLYSIFFNLP